MKRVSHQMVHCANHDRNMFILVMIETTSPGSNLNLNQIKPVEDGGQKWKGGISKDTTLGP